MKSIILTLFFISVNPLIGYSEQYLCVTEHSTGFSYDKASKSFKHWIYVKGRKIKGLAIRREAEKNLYLGNDS